MISTPLTFAKRFGVIALSSVTVFGNVACGASAGDGGDGASGGSLSGGTSSGAGGTSGGMSTGAVGSGENSAGGSAPSGGSGGGLSAVICDESSSVSYLASGLPQLETNPGAPIVLYLEYDGGVYAGSSGDETLSGYNSSGSASTFDETEKAEIIESVTHVGRYYAMFDVNVTTIDSVRTASKGWGWIVISEDISGGSASTASTAIGKNEKARAKCGAATVRDADRSRRIAHELGHNFTLHHSGVWVSGTFYKWEDYDGWDKVYGPIMGGGGKGERNGWALGYQEYSETELQDDMEIIRSKVMSVGGSLNGWRKDDFEDGTIAPFCAGESGALYRKGILGNPDDEDTFEFVWQGGALTLDAIIPEVSAALLSVEVRRGEENVLSVKNESNATASATKILEAGVYRVVVRSTGIYGAIGAYEISLHP